MTEKMKYTVIGTPRVESEYSDEYETTMVIDLQREDGETGDVWIVAGVPDYLRGTSDAARTQDGYMDVRVFGDCVDMWCPESFRVADEDGSYRTVAEDVVRACGKVALETHREAMAETTASKPRILPASVLARWSAEDWDDETMTASKYTYETEDGPIELSEEEAGRYVWGQTEDNVTGGCQRGDLRE